MSLTQKKIAIGGLSFIFFVSVVFVNALEYQKHRPERHPEAVINAETKVCIDCHMEKGISKLTIASWKESRHAEKGVGCADCHGSDEDVVHRVKGVVLASKCASCHKEQYKDFGGSAHARAWLSMQNSPQYKDLSSDVRDSSCARCHNVGELRLKSLMGGDPKEEAKKEESMDEFFSDDEDNGKQTEEAILDPTDEKVSIGRCDSCHTRHRFDVKEAQKPEACLTCHLTHDGFGQSRTYEEAKHGVIYNLEKNLYFEKSPKDRRAPVCTTCHMSKGGHDVSRGISIGGVVGATVEAPKTSGFKLPVIPQQKFEEARINMTMVCQNCHSSKFGNRQLDMADNMKKEADKIFIQAVDVVEQLHKDGLVKYSPEKDFFVRQGKNTKMTKILIGTKETEPIRHLVEDLYISYTTTWKSAYHMDPERSYWEGFVPLNRKLSEIKAEATKLRKGASK